MPEILVIHGQRMEVSQCGICGVVYTVPEIIQDYHRRHGGFSYCPNGHQWGWRQDDCEEARTRRERDLLKQQLAQKNDEIAALQERVKREEDASSRLRKRAAAGVCPCCHRSFAALARHMKAKHPNFSSTNGVNVDKPGRTPSQESRQFPELSGP